MATKRIVIDPMTRIEGHLKIRTSAENGIIVDARASAEMFRGIEKALIGYDVRVAQHVTQRVCGICPYAHAEAASHALENAMKMKPNPNGQLLRSLITAAYHLQDYLLHFYQLCSLDFIDITSCLKYQGKDKTLLGIKTWIAHELKSSEIFPATPFFPRYEADYSKNDELNISAVKNYADSLAIMADLHKMVAIFGGKAPHPVTLEAGGVTTIPTFGKIAKYKTWFRKAEQFITEKYYNDLLGVLGEFKGYFQEGKGYGNLLSYPYFPDKHGEHFAFAGGATIHGKYQPLDMNLISEDHTYAYYEDLPSTGIKPLMSTQLKPITPNRFEQERDKANGKYSWAKAPRYNGEPMEVGPVARLINTYHSKTNPRLQQKVDQFNRKLGITLADYPSVMGRHLSRFILASETMERIKEQIEELSPNEPAFVEGETPRNARGYGLTEATRGALAHWIETDSKGYIQNYELIVPTTWNISPRDSQGKPGPVEKMLLGTNVNDTDHPIELARIVRSTDPCLACSVH
ncbi:MAG: nickel-dependent hydrogenase large subunit [SAR324 cluster bacterium]|nr:nickel-dependent hydrogenase large subunit [SAR324 cluster bacterium]